MLKHTAVLFFLFLLSGCEPGFRFVKPAIWGDLQPGKHFTGYSVLEKRDAARGGRPIQISIWYPASAPVDTLAAMTYGDYFYLSATEKTFSPLTRTTIDSTVRDLKEFMSGREVPAESVDKWLNCPMGALRDVPWAEGKFPLILIAEGNGQSAFYHAILGEFLASHGFVVATCPSQSRISHPPTTMEEAFAQVFEQAEDLKFVMDAMRDDPRVDAEHTSAISHSFGARSAFVLGLTTKLQALVSLDGGIANKHGREWIDKVDLDTAHVHLPILHIYQEVDDIVEPDFSLLSSLHASERLLVRIDTLHHPHFSSMGFVAGTIPGMDNSLMSPNVLHKISAICNLTLEFITSVDKTGVVDPDQLPVLDSVFFQAKILHATKITG